MKKHIITIAGKLGSGKSTTAKKLAEVLGYQHKSTGDFMRALAQERGITLAELGTIATSDSSVDTALDDFNIGLGKQENIVLDSRLGFHFIPDSFKVFLELEPHIAAERILKNTQINPNRKNEDTVNFDSVENILTSNETRLASERKRYKEIYGILDHTAHENFDLVLDTGSPEYNNNVLAIVEAISKKYREWLGN